MYPTSAVPALALWPHCSGFLGQAGVFGHRTPLPAPLLGRGSRSVLFQSSQLGRRGPGVYDGITALRFLGSITQGVHLWFHTNTETQTLHKSKTVGGTLIKITHIILIVCLWCSAVSLLGPFGVLTSYNVPREYYIYFKVTFAMTWVRIGYMHP